MQMTLPQWPASLPRVWKPMARFTLKPRDLSDMLAIQRAREIERRLDALRCSNVTGTWTELIHKNKGDYSAMSTTGAETSFLGGQNIQPFFAAGFFGVQFPFRAFSILARGIMTTTTGTPTFTFQVRLGSTIGISSLTGTSIGVSAAITSITGITNKWWELRLDAVCTVSGQGSGNATWSGSGYVTSPGGFASPFIYPLEPTTPDTATWTSTFDDSVTQYLNLSATLQATGAPALTCKQLLVFGYN